MIQHLLITATMLIILLLTATGTAQVSVTIYNNNIGLVREVRSTEFKKGIQKFKFIDVAALIKPETVRFSSLTAPSDLTLLEQNFEYDLVGTTSLLQKHLNQSIIATTENGPAFNGRLLNISEQDIILELQDKTIKVVKAAALETIAFPSLPAGLITRPTLAWTLDCKKKSSHQTEISYITQGLTWNADYVALISNDETGLDLSGWITINNTSGTAYQDATLKLVAGDVHLVRPEARISRRYKNLSVAESSAPPQFEEKPFFEYHLYTLQRKATIENRQLKQISLFQPVQAASKKIYTYDTRRDQKKISVTLEFKNSSSDRPGSALPAGTVRVYKRDDDGSQIFIGEDHIDHTPLEETVRLHTGDAFDLRAERIVTEAHKISSRSRRETIDITLRNHKKTAVTIAVVEHFRGDWKIINKTAPITKQDAYKTEFEARVKPESTTVVNYTVVYTW
ncbi:MAG: DUF4139 domain-containing protein [Deltaproteobacteria bacterium]|nr:DUF4139 domain-containing protein [Deltaproteobacteria bacterium]